MARLGREKRMLAYSETEQQDIIERATEREMTRSVIESKGSERHSDERNNCNHSGGNALRGDTRSHPEHDG